MVLGAEQLGQAAAFLGVHVEVCGVPGTAEQATTVGMWGDGLDMAWEAHADAKGTVAVVGAGALLRGEMPGRFDEGAGFAAAGYSSQEQVLVGVLHGVGEGSLLSGAVGWKRSKGREELRKGCLGGGHAGHLPLFLGQREQR
ncbi:hypothetical protein GCM10008957_32790 [Deinococcus ruber]|uniref:Uncharacterized protein n=1 Tax=Deinococcus ruber TaxID=1848197 RepID=A0A918CE10_9DEIO|nr:hypothetical protein GCM10008957_32790 [Deinococcus ruber]